MVQCVPCLISSFFTWSFPGKYHPYIRPGGQHILITYRRAHIGTHRYTRAPTYSHRHRHGHTVSTTTTTRTKYTHKHTNTEH